MDMVENISFLVDMITETIIRLSKKNGDTWWYSKCARLESLCVSRYVRISGDTLLTNDAIQICVTPNNSFIDLLLIRPHLLALVANSRN